MSNAVATRPRRQSFSVAITTDKYKNMINRSLQDPKRAQRFISAITSAVAVNPELQDCDPATILAGALLGESLGLSPSPQLGQYYLIPFENTVKDANGKTVYLFDEAGNHIVDSRGKWVAAKDKKAKFVLGYKGYIQLALRSGYYRHLNVIAVKEGELVRFDPLTEEAQLSLIQDELAREAAPTVGYLAMFEYLNGFRKTIYWGRDKMEAHALRYSKGYAAKKGYTFWEKDFDAMAFKTMLRQLISKWGIMSIDLQTAFEQDVVTEDPDYLQPEELQLPDPTARPEPEPEPDGFPSPEELAPASVSSHAEEDEVSLDDL